MKSIETAKTWLSDTFDAETRATVQALIDGNPDELNEAFHKKLRIWYRRNARYYGHRYESYQ